MTTNPLCRGKRLVSNGRSVIVRTHRNIGRGGKLKLFVGNLSFKATDDDLRTAFEQFGIVTSARVAKERDTGRSRGFGFVEMPDDGAAKKAVDNVKDKQICGRVVKVSEARTREHTP